MTLPGLTRRQRDLLAFIAGYIEREGVAPNYAEMVIGIGAKSKSAIARLVDGLVERGHLVRVPFRARAIALTAAARGEADGYVIRLPDPIGAVVRRVVAKEGVDPAAIVQHAVERAFLWATE